jgi:quinol monooxygenase YgiN
VLVIGGYADSITLSVSVAGCLGYDVLEQNSRRVGYRCRVSVAGCLGYDVLDTSYRR